ncbi:MAG: hypothetical protein ABIJ16_05930 [Bacteroidota bacterium]
MMKTITISILACLLFSFAYAQAPYKVITVNGDIVAKNAGVKLKNGIEVKSDDNFDFLAPGSRAALINPDFGRVLLTESNSGNAFSKAAFAPAMSSVKTRGFVSDIIFTQSQLSEFFSDNLLVIDRLEIRIDEELFPQNDKGYFFLRYMYNGEEINKRLSFKSDTLIIDKSELYTIDGVPIPNPQVDQMKLYYYELLGDNSKAIFISTFALVFISNEQLKEEAGVIISAMEGQPYDQIFSEVYDFITSYYGDINNSYVESWLEKEFNLKKK